MPKVFYLQDSRQGREQFLPYMATIDAFSHGENSGLHLEQLHYPVKPAIWSMRSDIKTRILYIPYTQYEAGEAVQGFLLLDVVLNHDYAKSRFLRNPQVLATVLRKLGAKVDETAVLSLKEFVFEDIALDNALRLGAVNSTPPGRDLVALEYYHKEYIGFNTEQSAVLKAALPVVISGPPGSGKSYIALSMLLKYVREHRDLGEVFKILYLTRSFRLVSEMKAGWQAMLAENDAAILGDTVEFKTENELLREHLDVDTNLTDEGNFPRWYKSYCERHRHSIERSIDVETLWLEFRIRCGYSEENYRRLSVKHAIQVEFRDFVCDVYRAYEAYLSANKLVAPELYSFSAAGPYTFIVVDESQDYSFGNLQGYYRFANGQLACFVGELQMTEDKKPRIPYLHDELGMEVKFLPTTYRCSRRVIEVANRLTELTHRMTGGLSAKGESSSLVAAADAKLPLGDVMWLEPSPHNLALLRNKAQDPRCVVLSSEAFQEMANRELQSPMGCLSYSKAKGLEYDEVIIWLPFGDENWTAICAQLMTRDGRTGYGSGAGSGLSMVHRPKAGQGDDTFRRNFHGLITALTRAKVRVYLVQRLEHPFNVLQKALDVRFVKVWDEKADDAIDTSLHRSAWIDQAGKLLLDGNINAAARIFDTFGMSESFNDFHRHIMAAVSQAKEVPVARTVSATTSPTAAGAGAVETSLAVGPKKTPPPANATMSVSKIDNEKIRAFLSNPETFCQDGKNRRILERALKTSGKEGVEHTLIYKLCQSAEGIDSLNWLANNKDKMFASIPAQVWLEGVSKGVDLGKSPLFFLSQQEKGYGLLKVFLVEKLSVLPTLFSEALGRMDAESQTSPVYHLSVAVMGISFLNYVLNKWPVVFYAIPVQSWARICVADANAMPIYYLAAISSGRALLKKWLEKAPLHFSSLPAHAWTTARTADAGIQKETTTLSYLALNLDGLEILALMMEKCASIFAEISIEAWTRAVPAEDNAMPLHGILRERDFFFNLWQKYPEKILAIPGSVWGIEAKIYTQDNYGMRANLLYFLAQASGGPNILSKYLETAPHEVRSIPAMAWAKGPSDVEGPPEPDLKKMYMNSTVLNELCCTQAGINFLCQLLDSLPDVILSFPSQVWTLPMQYSPNRTVLYSLSTSLEGRYFLFSLIAKTPDIIHALPRDAWRHKINDDVHDCPLYHLIFTEDDEPSFILLLLYTLPEVALNIPGIVWDEMIFLMKKEIKVNSRKHLSDPYRELKLFVAWQEEKTTGLFNREAFLDDCAGFCQDNQNYFLLKQALHFNDKEGIQHNLIYSLSRDAQGVKALTWLESYPFIYRSKKIWSIAVVDGEEVGASAMFLLSQTPEGRNFLWLKLNDLYTKRRFNPSPSSVSTIKLIPQALGQIEARSQTSAIYHIIKSPEGTPFFNQFHSLFRMISMAAWVTPCAHEGGATPLYWLVKSRAGRNFLQQWILEDPKDFSTIPSKLFHLPLSETSEEEAGYTLLFRLLLSEDDDGLELLSLMMKEVPSLFEQIAAEISGWLHCVAKMGNATPLHIILKSRAGIRFYLDFFKKYPAIAQEQLHLAWQMEATLKSKEGACTHASLLNLIAACPIDGPLFLRYFLLHAPTVFDSIPLEAWVQPMDHDEKIFPLATLGQTEEGSGFLSHLLMQMPHLIPLQYLVRLVSLEEQFLYRCKIEKKKADDYAWVRPFYNQLNILVLKMSASSAQTALTGAVSTDASVHSFFAHKEADAETLDLEMEEPSFIL